MFVNETLKTHLETSATIQLKSLVLAEWNMNMPDNIFKLGNYRYRPTSPGSQFYTLPVIFDSLDSGQYYIGATDADVVVDGGFNNSGTPQQFTLRKEKMKMLYSLEDCIKPFRPRSGINKPLYFTGSYMPNSGANIAQRPRWYMPSRYDQFRYWTSYRTENNIEYGIAKNISNAFYFIDDAVPFVVYKNQVPANRLVVKMQTGVGTVNLGPFTTSTGTIADPLYGNANSRTPARWRVQYLNGNNWTDAYVFNQNDTRSDGSPIVGPDGYVELQYGLIIPSQYQSTFKFVETLSSTTMLPESSVAGYAYLVIPNDGDLGTFYIWNNNQYETFTPQYGWTLASGDINNQTSFVTDLTSPSSFNNTIAGGVSYREFQYLRGIRVVVETMNKFDSTFDLIEFSPRLVVNVSDKTMQYDLTKILSDIGVTSLPVGQLLASTGTISLFDDDQAFNENNSSSIVANYIKKNIKFVFYEIISSVEDSSGSLYDYYVPIKTMYSEGLPQSDINAGSISIQLRDFYFFLESMPAPRLLLTEVSLSFAITTLLDFIGFTNYTFKRVAGESDPVIPYFFVAPDQNVAEVLNQLALATQTAMFFDEYNNFVVMSKNYLMPTTNERPTDFVLLGNNNQTDSGVIENASSGNLPNIIEITSQDKKVYNDGKITYTVRYLQRTYGSIRQSSMVDKEKTWIYKPALLWEVGATQATKTINEVASQQGNYVLGAIPINSNLPAVPPTVSGGVVINNTIDLGENVYWLTRYQGYFYSSGEIIRYDAAQFNITGTGNVWITSNQEYQRYFSTLPFNGKIYPTGLVRIYAIPYYETIDGIERLQPGAVYEHGRGQFGTPIVLHTAGIDSYWSNNLYVRGCDMRSELLFNLRTPVNIIVENVTSTSSTFYVDNINLIQSGYTVNLINGTGELSSAGQTFIDEINPEKDPETNLYSFTVTLEPDVALDNATIQISQIPNTELGAAGVSNDLAKQTTRNGVIKNFMATNYLTDSAVNNLKSTQTGTIQSSALIMNGPSFKTTEVPLDFISYVYKNLDNAYKLFGTRIRVIGKIENNENRAQTPIGSTSYYQVTGALPNQNISIGGGSGGIAVLLNPETNNGYYFEIVAMTEDNIESYITTDNAGNPNISINNVVFYKVKKDSSNNDAIPIKLWGGLTSIIVDDGRFTGQYRMAGEENTTVYDLSVEYEDIGTIRRFYLYINNKLIKVVDDTDPLPVYNNMAMFVRGSSRCMFENVYALAENYSQNTVFTVGETLSSAFGDYNIDANESFRKYAMSGILQATYLAGISSQQPPKYNMYFDEFGTIMRECAYFDIKYDRSYPALYAQLSPTLNRIKGYTTSGFQADSYGAEFLIFNATDTALNLDETTGNYLRIQGITFTQDTTYELTVDEYFKKRSNLSNPQFQGSPVVTSSLVEKAKYDEIKQSRIIYGKNEFAIDTPYIQSEDDAQQLMGWVINKVMKPKKAIGVNIFAVPTLQLGDIVTINYKDSTGLDLVAPTTDRFVIYNIEYGRNPDGPTMTIYLSEV